MGWNWTTESILSFIHNILNQTLTISIDVNISALFRTRKPKENNFKTKASNRNMQENNN